MILPSLIFLHGFAAAEVGLPSDDGSQIAVSLVTFGPGQESWQRFGHNALWLRDPVRGIDTLYNYGRFSFEEENFLLRFARGHMRYWVEPQDRTLSFDFYQQQNRSLDIQTLALTPEQRVALRDFLEWNIKPENAIYAYDYYTDNCSTRVRDALDRVLGGEIQGQTSHTLTGATFRSHMQARTTQSVWLYTSLLLVLGPSVDRAITQWEEMFIPAMLQEHLRAVMVPSDDGSLTPLVKEERTLFERTLELPDVTSGTWIFWHLLLGGMIAVAFVSLGTVAAHSRVARLAFTGLAGLWVCIIGVAGTILAGLWIATDHLDAAYNENLFFVTPFALPLMFLIPRDLYRTQHVSGSVSVLSHLVLGSTLIGLGLQALPWFDQVNGEIVALVLPANVALWFALMRLFRTDGRVV